MAGHVISVANSLRWKRVVLESSPVTLPEGTRFTSLALSSPRPVQSPEQHLDGHPWETPLQLL